MVVTVPSSSGDGEYEIEIILGEGGSYTCPCRGFFYRQKCGHARVERVECGWVSGVSDEPQNGRQSQLGICPRCGGETDVVM